MIPYSHQFIDEDDVRAVSGTVKSDWLTQGPKVREFEEALAKFCGVKFAVAVSSGTAALQAAYFAAGIGVPETKFSRSLTGGGFAQKFISGTPDVGQEIITSPMTFAATTNAALWQGARPVFVDVEKETGNIDAKLIEKKITKRTKAIVAVDYAGLPCDYDALRKIAKKHKLILIADAAHSLGGEYKGKPVGGLADLTTLSFHPVKSITTGEGGAVLTNDENFYRRAVMFRSHGITKDKNFFVNESDGPWYHEMQDLGLNYRLTDIQAALGVTQLAKLRKFMAARRKVAEFYNKELAGIKNLELPFVPAGRESSFHLYPIRLIGQLQKRKREIFEKLQQAGIGVQVHYIPVYLHPYYQKLGYKRGLCPLAEDFYKSEISIPVYPGLKKPDQKIVVSAIKKILNV